MRNARKGLKILMIERGLSQKTLATLANVHRATVNGICNGRMVPSEDQAARIARVLQVQPADIFGN